MIVNRRRKIWHISIDFSVSVIHRREIEKIGKYLDLVREVRKFCNMNMKLELFVMRTLGTNSKSMTRPGKLGIRIMLGI